MDETLKKELDGQDFVRLANNFYTSLNLSVEYNRIALDSQICNYIAEHRNDIDKKHKVAFTFICLNPLYWEYAKAMVEGARRFLLPGHNVDFLFWTDMPEDRTEIEQKVTKAISERDRDVKDPVIEAGIKTIVDSVVDLRKQKDVVVFPTEPIAWPYPTLFRYNLFLQQEEKLKEYDYIFYCDIDMKFVNVVGDEILGDGLTAAQHPMYALRKEYFPPYEPNVESEAYIPRPGKVVLDNNVPRFVPLYYAGGFQGGKSDKWIEAMKEMRKMIDKDMSKNYIPIWNDESVWNKYLFLNPPSVVLTPSYIYPDSLIEEYYSKLWGCVYVPRLITITKWFSLSKEGGTYVQKLTKNL